MFPERLHPRSVWMSGKRRCTRAEEAENCKEKKITQSRVNRKILDHPAIAITAVGTHTCEF